MITLVTGANGFVGRHLLARLDGAIPLGRADADLQFPLPPLSRADVVVHCAAEIDDPAAMVDVNVGGTERLVRWATASSVRTFILLSTGAAAHPTTLYARTKRDAEEIVLQAADSMNVLALRLFFPYGPGQGSARLVPRLIAAIRSGSAVSLGSDGGPRISATFVDDVVEAIARSTRLSGAHVLDVGGPTVSMHELAVCIGGIVGREPLFAPNSVHSQDWIADREELRKHTGFAPAVSIQEGLRSCV